MFWWPLSCGESGTSGSWEKVTKGTCGISPLEAGNLTAVNRLTFWARGSTGGTLAGLASGFALAGREHLLTGVCVAGTAETLGESLVRLSAETQALLGLPPLSLESVTLTDAFIGDGYGIPSAGSLDAIRRCALEEGLLLDPNVLLPDPVGPTIAVMVPGCASKLASSSAGRSAW